MESYGAYSYKLGMEMEGKKFRLLLHVPRARYLHDYETQLIWSDQLIWVDSKINKVTGIGCLSGRIGCVDRVSRRITKRDGNTRQTLSIRCESGNCIVVFIAHISYHP